MNTTDKLTELPINFVSSPIETKFIPIETKKKFSVQLNVRSEV